MSSSCKQQKPSKARDGNYVQSHKPVLKDALNNEKHSITNNCCLTCLQAVVLGAVDRRILHCSPGPVAHSVGHPVVEADRGGLRQQWVLRQHVCPDAVS